MTKSFRPCPPDINNFTKSLLNIGYSHYVAVLDIIDNAVAADASKIWIHYEKNEDGVNIIISDNGIGMNEDELFEAMRIASSDPTILRKNNSDLGKFGLGLKLASFSLSDQFQVISKTINGVFASFKWNLDIVRQANDWLLEEIQTDKFYSNRPRNQGTDVYITKLRMPIDNLDQVINRLRTHIAVVYQKLGNIEFYIEDKIVNMIDPFFVSYEASNYSDPDIIEHKGQHIFTQSFQVPHKDKLEKRDKDLFNSIMDIGMSDGIYLFRKNRLIAWSGWEGLGVNKRIGDLQRLAIYINESSDELFNIEVKKSQFSILDDSLRNKIKSKIKIFYSSAKRPYKKRAELSLKDISDLWEMRRNDQLIYFSINRNSLIIKKYRQKCISLSQLLLLLESTLPVDSILYYLNNDRIDRNTDNKNKLDSAKLLLENNIISEQDYERILRKYG